MSRKKHKPSEPAKKSNSNEEVSAYEYLLELIAQAGSGGVVIGGKTCHTLEEAEAAIARELSKKR